MDTRAKELVGIGDGLFSKKSQWDSLNQEIAEHFYPMRADFTQSFTLGDDFSTDLMDSYPVLARETLGNLPNAMLRQGDWFDIRTGEEEIDEAPENANWLEYATKATRKLIYDRRANFVRATTEADHDYVTFGNPVLSVEESPTRDHFLFRAWHPKSCAWLENAVGRIDHLHRNVVMTARAIRRRWPRAKLHSEIEQALQKNPAAEFKVRQIVLPVDEVYGDDRKAMRRFKDMPFVSIYVDCSHEEMIDQGPLPVFSFVVPRWRTVSGFQYGFSPATINALPDGRMMQALARIILEQGEKAVDAPMFAKGEIFRDSVNRYSGGLTYVDLEGDERIQDVIFQEDVSRGLPFGMEMKQDVRGLIAESFLLNKLMLPSTKDMTAFETNARLDEFRRAALPFFGPIEADYHTELLDTTFQMAVKARAFNVSEMPKVLSDREVTFTFDTPLNTAEGRKNVIAFQESIQILAAAAQFDPGIPKRWDLPKMVDDAVRGTGAPSDWEHDEDTRQSEEETAKQVQGLAGAAAALREGAGVATDVAGATVAMKEAGLV